VTAGQGGERPDGLGLATVEAGGERQQDLGRRQRVAECVVPGVTR
jgi:hypothetical protein